MDSYRVHAFAYPNITSHCFHKKIFYMNKWPHSEWNTLPTNLEARNAFVTVSGNMGYTHKGVNFEVISKWRASSSSWNCAVTSSDGRMH